MEKELQAYIAIGQGFKDSEESQMFGKPCFKIQGKAFICFFADCMVFKLSGSPHKEALQKEAALLFDPSGKGRPMKEWVQLSFRHQEDWPGFAQAAYDYALQTAKRMQ